MEYIIEELYKLYKQAGSEVLILLLFISITFMSLWIITALFSLFVFLSYIYLPEGMLKRSVGWLAYKLDKWSDNAVLKLDEATDDASQLLGIRRLIFPKILIKGVVYIIASTMNYIQPKVGCPELNKKEEDNIE